jgi:carboxymethylenebutenolidase
MTTSTDNFYLAVPPSGKGPGVLVLHAWWGLNDTFRDFCDRLAQAGFVALAPDLFSGKVFTTIEDAERNITQFDEEHEVPPIVLSALEGLRNHPAVIGSGLAVVGFSMGAYWALWLAQYKPDLIQAVTVFYGTNGGSGDFSHSKAAFLGHFAEKDPYETEASIRELEKNLESAGLQTNFFTYPETGHWFFERDRSDAFNPQAAQLAWDRTVAFLQDQIESNQ